MAAIRTPGITVDPAGNRFIDKRHRGFRIGIRVGAITQEQAELRLQTEIGRIDIQLARVLTPGRCSVTAPHATSSSQDLCAVWRPSGSTFSN